MQNPSFPTILSIYKTNFKIMFDYKITAYNKLGKVQEVETIFCSPDSIELSETMLTMSDEYGYAEATDTMNTHMGEYGDRPRALGERRWC